ncbi:MAG: hypothetical protein QW303_02620 [Nitrososphaerota archaeon]
MTKTSPHLSLGYTEPVVGSHLEPINDNDTIPRIQRKRPVSLGHRPDNRERIEPLIDDMDIDDDNQGEATDIGGDHPPEPSPQRGHERGISGRPPPRSEQQKGGKQPPQGTTQTPSGRRTLREQGTKKVSTELPKDIEEEKGKSLIRGIRQKPSILSSIRRTPTSPPRFERVPVSVTMSQGTTGIDVARKTQTPIETPTTATGQTSPVPGATGPLIPPPESVKVPTTVTVEQDTTPTKIPEKTQPPIKTPTTATGQTSPVPGATGPLTPPYVHKEPTSPSVVKTTVDPSDIQKLVDLKNKPRQNLLDDLINAETLIQNKINNEPDTSKRRLFGVFGEIYKEQLLKNLGHEKEYEKSKSTHDDVNARAAVIYDSMKKNEKYKRFKDDDLRKLARNEAIIQDSIRKDALSRLMKEESNVAKPSQKSITTSSLPRHTQIRIGEVTKQHISDPQSTPNELIQKVTEILDHSEEYRKLEAKYNKKKQEKNQLEQTLKELQENAGIQMKEREVTLNKELKKRESEMQKASLDAITKAHEQYRREAMEQLNKTEKEFKRQLEENQQKADAVIERLKGNIEDIERDKMDYIKELEKKHQEIEQLKKQLKEEKTELETKQKEQYENKIREMERQKKEVQEKLEGIEKDKKNMSEQIQKLNTEKITLENEMKQQLEKERARMTEETKRKIDEQIKQDDARIRAEMDKFKTQYDALLRERETKIKSLEDAHGRLDTSYTKLLESNQKLLAEISERERTVEKNVKDKYEKDLAEFRKQMEEKINEMQKGISTQAKELLIKHINNLTNNALDVGVATGYNDEKLIKLINDIHRSAIEAQSTIIAQDNLTKLTSEIKKLEAEKKAIIEEKDELGKIKDRQIQKLTQDYGNLSNILSAKEREQIKKLSDLQEEFEKKEKVIRRQILEEEQAKLRNIQEEKEKNEKDLQNRLANIQREYDNELNNMKKNEEELKRQIRTLESRNTELQKKLNKTTDELESEKEKVNGYGQALESIKSKKDNEIQTVQQKLKEIEKQKNEATLRTLRTRKRLHEEISKVKETSEKLEKEQDKYKSALTRINELENTVTRLTHELEELSHSGNKNKPPDDVEQRIDEIVKTTDQITAKNVALTRKLGTLSGLDKTIILEAMKRLDLLSDRTRSIIETISNLSQIPGRTFSWMSRLYRHATRGQSGTESVPKMLPSPEIPVLPPPETSVSEFKPERKPIEIPQVEKPRSLAIETAPPITMEEEETRVVMNPPPSRKIGEKEEETIIQEQKVSPSTPSTASTSSASTVSTTPSTSSTPSIFELPRIPYEPLPNIFGTPPTRLPSGDVTTFPIDRHLPGGMRSPYTSEIPPGVAATIGGGVRRSVYTGMGEQGETVVDVRPFPLLRNLMHEMKEKGMKTNPKIYGLVSGEDLGEGLEGGGRYEEFRDPYGESTLDFPELRDERIIRDLARQIESTLRWMEDHPGEDPWKRLETYTYYEKLPETWKKEYEKIIEWKRKGETEMTDIEPGAAKGTSLSSTEGTPMEITKPKRPLEESSAESENEPPGATKRPKPDITQEQQESEKEKPDVEAVKKFIEEENIRRLQEGIHMSFKYPKIRELNKRRLEMRNKASKTEKKTLDAYTYLFPLPQGTESTSGEISKQKEKKQSKAIEKEIRKMILNKLQEEVGSGIESIIRDPFIAGAIMHEMEQRVRYPIMTSPEIIQHTIDRYNMPDIMVDKALGTINDKTEQLTQGYMRGNKKLPRDVAELRARKKIRQTLGKHLDALKDRAAVLVKKGKDRTVRDNWELRAIGVLYKPLSKHVFGQERELAELQEFVEQEKKGFPWWL